MTNSFSIDSYVYIAWDEFYNQLEQHHNQFKGRGDVWSHRYLKSFRKIAEICADRQLDVADFVITSFHLLKKGHLYIVPSDLTKAKIVEQYIAFREKMGNPIEQSWESQTNTLNHMLERVVPDLYSGASEILKDVGLPFAPWFRLMAGPLDAELFEIFGELAWRDIRSDRRLLRFLRECEPERVARLEQQIGDFGDTIREAYKNGE